MIDERMAEVAGVFAGDGTLYKTNWGHVMEVRGEPVERNYYQNYIAPLFGSVLGCELKVIERKSKGGFLIGIRKCGKIVYKLFHEELGFHVGKKSHIVQIPSSVLESGDEISIAYLRGMFDTDGSVNTRIIRGKYLQPFVVFTTVSEIHKNQIHTLLKKLGFNAWKERYNIRMGGWSTVRRFFEVVRPHNDLKTDKWNKIVRQARIA